MVKKNATEKFDEIPEEKVDLNVDVEEKKSKKNKNIRAVKYLKEKYEFRYNLFIKHVEYRRKAEVPGEYLVIEDRDENNLMSELDLIAGNHIPEADFRRLLGSKYLSDEYEPIQEYLFSLPPWDGTDRFNLFLQQIQLKIEDDRPLLQELFKKWFITMVASLFDFAPGERKSFSSKIKNETFLIFTGDEGRGKTRFFETLVPRELAQDYMYIGGFDFRDKDFKEMLATKILLINDELAIFNRTEQEILKSTMSLPFVELRRAYGRKKLKMWRKASICGTTNDSQFLTDQGANRRYLPFNIHKIDIDEDFDIRLLYSQAMAEFRKGFNLWYNLEEIAALSSYNEQFRRKPQEEELIMLHYRIPTKEEVENNNGVRYLTPSDLMHELASKDEFKKMNTNDTVLKRVGKTMSRLGFEKRSIWIKGFNSSRDCWIVKDADSYEVQNIKKGNSEQTQDLI